MDWNVMSEFVEITEERQMCVALVLQQQGYPFSDFIVLKKMYLKWCQKA